MPRYHSRISPHYEYYFVPPSPTTKEHLIPRSPPLFSPISETLTRFLHLMIPECAIDIFHCAFILPDLPLPDEQGGQLQDKWKTIWINLGGGAGGNEGFHVYGGHERASCARGYQRHPRGTHFVVGIRRRVTAFATTWMSIQMTQRVWRSPLIFCFIEITGSIFGERTDCFVDLREDHSVTQRLSMLASDPLFFLSDPNHSLTPLIPSSCSIAFTQIPTLYIIRIRFITASLEKCRSRI